jgi:predicted metalloendopeptidase
MDRSVRPGDDFYQFANGKWLAATSIPADRVQVDSFTLLGHIDLGMPPCLALALG